MPQVQKGSGTKVRDSVPPSPTPSECFRLAVQLPLLLRPACEIIPAHCCCALRETKDGGTYKCATTRWLPFLEKRATSLPSL